MTVRSTKLIPATVVSAIEWSLMPALEIRLQQSAYDEGWLVSVSDISEEEYNDELDIFEFDTREEAVEQVKNLKKEFREQGYKHINVVR